VLTKSPAALEGALEKKRDLLSLIAVAALIGFGISTLASTLVEEVGDPWTPIVASTVLIVVGFILIIREIASSLSFSDDIEALIFVSRKDGQLLAPKRYKFSEELLRTLDAVKAENIAIYNDWETAPILGQGAGKKVDPIEAPRGRPDYVAVTRVTAPRNEQRPVSANLLEEAAFFVLLEELSTHLSVHFNETQNSPQVKMINREDISDFLLKNRVLNLLSTPIEQRSIFLNAFPDPAGRPQGEIYTLFGSNGSVYKRFDLVLPAESVIRETAANGVKIDNSRFSLCLSVHYTGTSGVITPEFAKNYMDRDWRDISPRHILIKIHGKIKLLSLLRSHGWEYYRWLDSFRERIGGVFAFKSFLDHIHWDIIEPLLHSMQAPIIPKKPPRPMESAPKLPEGKTESPTPSKRPEA